MKVGPMACIVSVILFGFLINAYSKPSYYTWTDENGQVRFAEEFSQIPEKYKKIAIPGPEGETATEKARRSQENREKQLREETPEARKIRLRQEQEAAEARLMREQEENLARERRRAFARKYQNSLLDSGLDIGVFVRGEDASYISIRWVLMNRVFVHKFINSDMVDTLRNLGFKELYFDDWGVGIFSTGYHIN